MELVFHGVRGLLPTSGHDHLRYGGHTTCLELRSSAGELVVLGAGSGLRALGGRLAGPFLNGSGEAVLLLDCTHLDRIQGLAHFQPLLVPGNRVTLYGPEFPGRSLFTILATSMRTEFSPRQLIELPARLEVEEADPEEPIEAAGVDIECCRLNHTAPALGWRLDVEERGVCYLMGAAPADGPLLLPPSCRQAETEAEELAELEEDLLGLLAGAELAVVGVPWKTGVRDPALGFSSIECAIERCLAAEVPRLCVCHFAPRYGDADLAAWEEEARAQAAERSGGQLELLFAREGLVL